MNSFINAIITATSHGAIEITTTTTTIITVIIVRMIATMA
jgi:hypothetical protein